MSDIYGLNVHVKYFLLSHLSECYNLHVMAHTLKDSLEDVKKFHTFTENKLIIFDQQSMCI